MSEDIFGFSLKNELIDQLKILAANDPDKRITRDFFRKETGIQDPEWRQFWVTFDLFKVAAGLAPNKQEKRFTRLIIKEASVKDIREYNEEKRNWDKLYSKPSNY